MSAKKKKTKAPPNFEFTDIVGDVYETEINEMLSTLLNGVPAKGGLISRDILVRMLFLAFVGGVRSSIIHKN